MVYGLSDDLIVEIISWLPATSLRRFRCVCKSWCVLIDNSSFVEKHLRQAVNTNSAIKLLLYTRPPRSEFNYYEPSRFSGRPPPLKIIDRQAFALINDTSVPTNFCTELGEFPNNINHDAPIVGSCNGLICVKGIYDRDFTNDNEPFRIIVWNPSTGKTRTLPQFDYFDEFEDLWYGSFYGFGYDSTTEDYKVVLGQPRNGIAVLALKMGSWRIIHEQEAELQLSQFKRIHDQGHFLKGSLHWVVSSGTKSIIVSFNLTDEKLHFFSDVSHLGNKAKHEMGISGNFLFFGTYTSENNGESITIWVMKEYGIDESWTKFIEIPKEIIPPGIGWLTPIFIFEDEQILMKISEHTLLWYNPKQNKWVIVHDSPPDGVGVAIYMETLVSPPTASTF